MEILELGAPAALQKAARLEYFIGAHSELWERGANWIAEPHNTTVWNGHSFGCVALGAKSSLIPARSALHFTVLFYFIFFSHLALLLANFCIQ
jgi:hypothetical protein